jgi:hypothetical protein
MQALGAESTTSGDALLKQKLQEKQRYFEQLMASVPARLERIAQLSERAATLKAELARQRPKDPVLIQTIFDLEQEARHEQSEVKRIQSKQEETEFYLDLAMLMREQQSPTVARAPVDTGWHKPVLRYGEADTSEGDDYEPAECDEDECAASEGDADDAWLPLNEAQEEPSARKPVRVENFIDREETRNSYAAQQVIQLLESGTMPREVMRVHSAQQSAQCTLCKGDLILVQSQYQCMRCHTPHDLAGQQVLEEGAHGTAQVRSMADRERTTYVQQYTYKKINHFKDWLSQFQAKENTVIPEEVLDKVRLALLQKKAKDLAHITPKQIHRILKEIGLPKYYEHRNLICNRISGNPPPFLTREQEQRLRDMFEALQEPFERCKPKGRKNFLSYSYVLHQLLRIAGHPSRIYTQFRVLSCRQRVAVHDSTWAKMMAMLDAQKTLNMSWPFFPTA